VRPATSWQVRITDADTTRELRRAVLRPHLPSGSELPGDHEPGVIHLAAFDGDDPVSACLIFPEECPWLPDRSAWRLRGMATDQLRRGTGAGAALVAEAQQLALASGTPLIWCLARMTAVGFYQRQGWVVTGDEFESVGVPHLRMHRELTG
jgi:predicted GNAT family N-acyltransferase